MTVITTKLTVAADGSVSVSTPLPPGVHDAAVTVEALSRPRRSVLDLPVHDGPWDDTVPLPREDMYRDGDR